MKTRIFITVLLMLTLATYAQTSRRGEQGRNTNQSSSNNQTARPKSEGVSTRSSTREYNNQTTRTNDNASSPRSSGSSNTAATRDYNNQAVRSDNNTPSRRSSVTSESASRDHSQPVRGNNNGSSDRPSTVASHRSDGGVHTWSPQTNNSHRGGTSGDAVTSSSTRRGPAHEANMGENRHYRESVRVSRPQSTYRHVVVANHHRGPGRVHGEWYHYRRPIHTHIYWTVNLHHDFRIFYPAVSVWRYPVGYEIITVPAYEADRYIGEVANIYGKVVEVYYAYQYDEYYLYFGDYYPYHEFSIVIPGREARLFSMHPERYFENSHVTVTGYVTVDEDKPEIIVHRASQIEVY